MSVPIMLLECFAPPEVMENMRKAVEKRFHAISKIISNAALSLESMKLTLIPMKKTVKRTEKQRAGKRRKILRRDTWVTGKVWIKTKLRR